MLKLIFFAFIFIMLVRFISRLFLPRSNKKSSKAQFFYQTFKNIRNQQKQQKNQQNQSNDANAGPRLDEIEEAEYEDVTDKD